MGQAAVGKKLGEAPQFGDREKRRRSQCPRPETPGTYKTPAGISGEKKSGWVEMSRKSSRSSRKFEENDKEEVKTSMKTGVGNAHVAPLDRFGKP